MSDSSKTPKTEEKKFSVFHGIFHKYDTENDDGYDDPEPEDEEVGESKAEDVSFRGFVAGLSDSAARSSKPGSKVHTVTPVRRGEEPKRPSGQSNNDRPEETQKKSRLGSVFGKLVEIITQPEDSIFLAEDDDVLEDAYSAYEGSRQAARAPSAVSAPASAASKAEPLSEKPEASVFDEIKAEKAEQAEKLSEDEGTSEINESQSYEAENNHASAEEEKKASEEKADASEEIADTSGEKKPAEHKTEITVRDVMLAKNTVTERTPVSFRSAPAGTASEDASASSADNKKPSDAAEAEKARTPVKVRPVPVAKKAEAPKQEAEAAERIEKASGDEKEQLKKEVPEEADQKETTSAEDKNPAKEILPEDATEVTLYTAPREKTARPAPVIKVGQHGGRTPAHETPKVPASAQRPAAPAIKTAADVPKTAAAAATVKAASDTTKTAAAAAAVRAASDTTKTAAAAAAAKSAAETPENKSPEVKKPAQTAVKPTVQQARPAAPHIVSSPKPAAAAKKDLSEAASENVIYHGTEGIPFIVMAGKFSRTIKAEYEVCRKYMGTTAPPPEPPSAPKAPSVTGKPPVQKKAAVHKKKPAEEAAAAAAASAAVTTEQEPQMPLMPEHPVKEKKPIKMPKKKKPVFSGIRQLFSSNDSFDENPDEEPEARPVLDDYRNVDEAEEIKSDINENFSKVFFRTIVLTATTAAALITALLAYFMPQLFGSIIRHGWLVYALINLALLAVSVFIDRYPIYSGLMSLTKLRGDSDTASAVAVVAVTIQTIFALFLPDVFINGTYHIYVPLVILSLLLGSIGKLLIVKRTADNFRFLMRHDAVYAGKIYTDIDNAEKMVRDLPSRKPIIAYTKRSAFMSNFLRLSYAADPVEELSRLIAPFTTIISLICGIAFGAVTKDVVGGVSSFALTSVILIPMCSLLAINIPMKNLSGSVLSKGAMLSGYESVKQFSDTNTIMLDYTQLYPKGSIILSGIKAFSESKIQDAILAGAAVTFAVNGPMTFIFENMIQDRQNMLPKVERVIYDDNMGLSGWIGGQRVLIGNRTLLERHNITPPSEKLEDKYRRMGNEITYISLGGELVAMFILTYKADRKIAEALRELEDNGVSFVVRTIDPNITTKHIAEKFSLYSRCVTVLKTGLGTICNDELSGKEKTSRAYLVTNGRIEAFAAAVSGCIKIKSTVTIAKIIQMLSISIGFVLVNVISFLSGFAKLGCFELLLYIGFWCVALIAVSAVARKIS